MRVMRCAGFLAVAVAAPFAAQAADGTASKDSYQYEKPDVWVSAGGRADVRVVDTHERLEGPTTVETPRDGGAPPRVVSIDPPPRVAPPQPFPRVAAPAPAPKVAAPEMGVGFAATALTLLLGGIAVLRDRKPKYDSLKG